MPVHTLLFQATTSQGIISTAVQITDGVEVVGGDYFGAGGFYFGEELIVGDAGHELVVEDDEFGFGLDGDAAQLFGGGVELEEVLGPIGALHFEFGHGIDFVQ